MDQVVGRDPFGFVVLGVVDVVVVEGSDFIPEEPGDADGVEGDVVAAASAGHDGDGADLHGEVGEGFVHDFQHGVEHGDHRFEGVGSAFVVSASVFDKDGADFGHVVFVLFDVGPGAVEALFFAAEEDEADGALGFEADFVEDTGGFEGDGGAVAVVGGAFGAGAVPGVDVGAHDDDFVGFFGAGDFGDDVIVFARAFDEPVVEVEFEFDRFAFFDPGDDFFVVGFAEEDLDFGGKFFGVDVPLATGYDEVAAAGSDPAEDSGFGDQRFELKALFEFAGGFGRSLAGPGARGAGHGGVVYDPLAFERAFEGFEFGFSFGVEDGFAAGGALGSGSPGGGGEFEVHRFGGDEFAGAGAAVESDGPF